MAHAHFIEVQQENGQTALVRADEITAVEPATINGIAGFYMHTAGCSLFAPGETVETIKNMMQSAQITVVTLQSRGLKPVGAVAAPAPPTEPARQVVVRAPPPVRVPELEEQEQAQREYDKIAPQVEVLLQESREEKAAEAVEEVAPVKPKKKGAA